MRHITIFFFSALLILPLQAKADVVVPDVPARTFESLQTMTLSLDVEPVLGENALSYSFGYTDEFFAGRGELTAVEKDELFQIALEDQKLFFELWSGDPFDPGTLIEESSELPAETRGSVKMQIPHTGRYFLVAYLTNEVRDRASYCARYVMPEDVCADDEYFLSFPHEATQAYFTRPLDSEEDWSDAFPIAFAGTRFTIETSFKVSNVLFLPGIKGSRLYHPSSGCEGCSIKLWEPSDSRDVRALFLDENGKSVNAGVHARAGDALFEVYSQKFYATFFSELTQIKHSGAFGEGWSWEIGAYDWRLSLTDIISKGARYDDRIYYNETNGVPYIEQLLRDLAATSPTGKVSIVAHSNGGIVAKALLETLGDSTDLVDKVIFVGVPQSGAPQALGAALFGHGESLPFDSCAEWVGIEKICTLLVDRGTARTFAEHAPMTYHLLPSEAYFHAASHPLARFSGSSVYTKEQANYGSSIDSFQELSSFVLALDGGRRKPEENDTVHANVLSQRLTAYAGNIHSLLDAWTPPESIEVHQLAGWGANTISGIDFYEEPRLFGLLGTEARYRPTFTMRGDGVVPAISGVMMPERENVERYWIDMREEERTHGDMFEAESIRMLIKNILTDSEDLPAQVAQSEFVLDPPPRKLFFFLHSPVTLGIRDELGRYSGLNPDGTVTLDIPGVEYGRFGEVQYLIVPSGEAYKLILRGLSKGMFSLDIQEQQGDDILRTTTIAGVPVDKDDLATIEIDADGNLSPLEIEREGRTRSGITLRPGEVVIYEPPKEEVIGPPVPVTPDSPSPGESESTRRSEPPLSSNDELLSQGIENVPAKESGTEVEPAQDLKNMGSEKEEVPIGDASDTYSNETLHESRPQKSFRWILIILLMFGLALLWRLTLR